jgi:hypothetical protein
MSSKASVRGVRSGRRRLRSGGLSMVSEYQTLIDKCNDYLDLIEMMMPHVKDDGVLQHVGFILDQWDKIYEQQY